MKKEDLIMCVESIEDGLDLISKEIANDLKPSHLLIDYLKEKLDFLKGE